jgi:hypothetical protein
MAPTYMPGTYRAKIIAQGFEQSSVKQTPCFFLQMKIQGRHDSQGQVQDCPQYERTYLQYLANDTGVAILRGDLQRLGVTVSDLTLLEPGVEGHISLVGRTIDVVCEHEPFNGQTRERWRISRPRKKLDLDSLGQLNAKFRHVLGGSPGAENTALPSNTTPGEDNTSS